ncbi:MAG TPA: hypothetical protein VM694_04450, partial [Polyangium sp.]|nr:hypothetical protein [Polyangium sp.]
MPDLHVLEDLGQAEGSAAEREGDGINPDVEEQSAGGLRVTHGAHHAANVIDVALSALAENFLAERIKVAAEGVDFVGGEGAAHRRPVGSEGEREIGAGDGHTEADVVVGFVGDRAGQDVFDHPASFGAPAGVADAHAAAVFEAFTGLLQFVEQCPATRGGDGSFRATEMNPRTCAGRRCRRFGRDESLVMQPSFETQERGRDGVHHAGRTTKERLA